MPGNIEAVLDGFEQRLTSEQQADPRFAFRVFMVGRTANRAPGADLAVEIIPPGSEEAAEVNRLLLKEVEKKKYLPSEIVSAIKGEGWDKFTMDQHTKLWKRLKAKEPAKSYGIVAVGKVWSWYEAWLKRVREECEQNPDKYRTLVAGAKTA